MTILDGALTWNLSKVIPRKDLPRIYTSCTPLNTTYTSPDGKISAQPPKVATGGPAQSELDAVREEIIAAIRSAPSRRLDNMISSLDAQTRLLKMHIEIIDDVRQEFQREKRKALASVVGVASIGVAIASLGIAFPVEILAIALPLAASSVLGAVGLSLYNNAQLEKLAKQLPSDEKLEVLFRRRFAREIIERDEGTVAIWMRIKPTVQAALNNLGIATLPKVTSSELRELDRILNSEIHALRRRAQASRSK